MAAIDAAHFKGCCSAVFPAKTLNPTRERWGAHGLEPQRLLLARHASCHAGAEFLQNLICDNSLKHGASASLINMRAALGRAWPRAAAPAACAMRAGMRKHKLPRDSSIHLRRQHRTDVYQLFPIECRERWGARGPQPQRLLLARKPAGARMSLFQYCVPQQRCIMFCRERWGADGLEPQRLLLARHVSRRAGNAGTTVVCLVPQLCLLHPLPRAAYMAARYGA